MNQETINRIIQLDKDFYSVVAKEFSATRQTPWSGWDSLLPLIQENTVGHRPLSVLDIACGNGRFYAFLTEKFPTLEFSYLGIDNNDALIEEAIQKYPSVEFQKLDVISDLSAIDSKFTIVAGFGITHHIPGELNRAGWFQLVSNLVIPGGILIFTNWEYHRDVRFHKQLRDATDVGIDAAELESGDYFLGWDDKKVCRYYHRYSKIPLKKMQLIKKYSADGPRGDLNTYYVYRK